MTSRRDNPIDAAWALCRNKDDPFFAFLEGFQAGSSFAYRNVSPNPDEEAIAQWIDREFTGWGVAVRRLSDSPIPGEPFMSMAAAKELTRRAVRELSALTPAEDVGGSGER